MNLSFNNSMSSSVCSSRSTSQNISVGSGNSSTPCFVAEKKLLAPDFVPGPYDVICARGSKAAKHAGNVRFRKTIKDSIPEYAKAKSKLQKSIIVTAIVDSVRDFTPNGGFVKKFEDGCWYEVGDAVAREKIGQCLRDALHTQYKSSTKAKQPRRKELKALKKLGKQVEKPPLQNNKHVSAKEDTNEISLTSIFYNALVDQGLNLDYVLSVQV